MQEFCEKKFSVLKALASMELVTRTSDKAKVKYDPLVDYNGFKFLQRVNSPKGTAFFIGIDLECKNKYWFYVEGEHGVSYWDFSEEGIYLRNFTPESVESPLTENLKKIIEPALNCKAEVILEALALKNALENGAAVMPIFLLKDICGLKSGMLKICEDQALYEAALSNSFIKYPVEFQNCLIPLFNREESMETLRSFEIKFSRYKVPEEVIKSQAIILETIENRIKELTDDLKELKNLDKQNLPICIDNLKAEIERNISNLQIKLIDVKNVTSYLNVAQDKGFDESFTKIKESLNSDDDLTLNTIIFILNLLKKIPLSKMGQQASTTFSQIFKEFGKFFYNSANNYVEPQEAIKLSILCFSLAEMDQAPSSEYTLLKMASYMSILKRTNRLKLDLETYCEEEPENFIENITKLLKDDFFNESLDLAITHSNNNAELEYIKLNYFLSLAYSKLNNTESANDYYQIAKKYLLASRDTNAYSKIIDFAKRFDNDIEILIKVIEANLDKNNSKEAEVYLIKAITALENTKAIVNDFTLLELATILYFRSCSKNNQDIGKQIFLKLFDDPNKTDHLIKNIIFKIKNDNKYFLCAKLFKELATKYPTSSKYYLNTAFFYLEIGYDKNQLDPEINYYCYLVNYMLSSTINLKYLKIAVEGGHEEAITEIQRLADVTEHHGELFEYLGDLYSKGDRLNKNYHLSAYNYERSGSKKSILKLIEMWIKQEIPSDMINPNFLIHKIYEMKLNLIEVNELIPIIEKFKEKEKYQKDAILILIHLHNFELSSCDTDKAFQGTIKKITDYLELYAANYPEAIIDIIPIFRMRKVVRSVSPDIIGKIFKDIYYNEDLRDLIFYDELKSVANALSEATGETQLLTLNCPDLRKNLTEEQLINVLNNHASNMNVNEVATLMVSLIVERKKNNNLINWLFNNKVLLNNILKNIDFVSQLNECENWIIYLKKPENIKYIQDQSPIPPKVNVAPKSSLVDNLLKITSIFTNTPKVVEKPPLEINTQIIVKAKTNFINRKKEMVELLYKREQELADKGSALYLFIQQMKKLVNEIDSHEALNNCINNLCENDSFFADYYQLANESPFTNAN